jgi:hypothetical protein
VSAGSGSGRSARAYGASEGESAKLTCPSVISSSCPMVVLRSFRYEAVAARSCLPSGTGDSDRRGAVGVQGPGAKFSQRVSASGQGKLREPLGPKRQRRPWPCAKRTAGHNRRVRRQTRFGPPWRAGAALPLSSGGSWRRRRHDDLAPRGARAHACAGSRPGFGVKRMRPRSRRAAARPLHPKRLVLTGPKGRVSSSTARADRRRWWP